MVPVVEHEEIEQFYCTGCNAWLTTGGTVHDNGEHEGHPCATDWRYSYDGGVTWGDEERVGMGEHLTPRYPAPNRKVWAAPRLKCKCCHGLGCLDEEDEHGQPATCPFCAGEGFKS